MIQNGGWRPIATAPKDGTLVLLFLPESAAFNIVFGRFDPKLDDEDESGWGWLEDRCTEAFPLDVPASHWMPLPDPPAAA